MTFRVYLLDGVDYVELEAENVDITTIFSVSDIKDISTKKDNITKQIQFKGTKQNNYAFGSAFHLNKSTSSSLPNKLFFNYNPLRTVDAIVMEDNLVIFKGTMRLLQVSVSKTADVSYQTVITGKFTEFKNIIQDKLLTDLDFSSMAHTYSMTNIQNSWTASKGENFVYPHVDYGHLYNTTALNADKSKFNVLNYRPALYVKEYFNRIFSQPELNGFTYEIKGNPAFINKFKSLSILDTQQKQVYTLQGFNTKYSKNPSQVISQSSATNVANTISTQLIPLTVFQGPPTGTISTYQYYYGSYNNVFFNYRTVTTDGIVTVTFSRIKNKSSNSELEFYVELIQRQEKGNNSPTDADWQTIERVQVNLQPSAELSNKTFTIPIGEREWTQGKQIAVRVFGRLLNPLILATGLPEYNITSADFSLPKDNATQFKADVVINAGDTIIPKAPEGIKQIDFIKSVVNLFNMYVYTESRNPKHVIFENYDDYYSLTSPSIIKNTAINWTKKVDLSLGYDVISNLTIPKSYLFTFKEDSDYINQDYKKKYNEVYGSSKFADSFGVTAEKKVELIFSPTPAIKEVGSEKMFPILYGVEGGQKKLQKSNIRIVFYNGLQPCEEYKVTKESFNAGSWQHTDLVTLTTYPQVSNYYLINGQPVDDIHFGRPKEFYFPATTAYINADTSYNSYYTGQVTELTDPNLFTIECDIVLNELDINNLDLKTPVFIDMSEGGHSYFKVLAIEYNGNSLTSKVTLQKVVLSSER